MRSRKTIAAGTPSASNSRPGICLRRRRKRIRRRSSASKSSIGLPAFAATRRLGTPKASLTEVAAEANVSAKYLATIWATLTETRDEIGPVAALKALWNDLPPPDAKNEAVRSGCERMREFVVGLRKQLVPEVKNLPAPGMQNGSQPLVLWKNRRMAANRMRYAGGALQVRAE